MAMPVIEVAITNTGDCNTQDEAIEAGKKYVEMFAVEAKNVPGIVRACCGQVTNIQTR
jgi:hypothetical protein